jgi:hypothetical protein
MTHLHKQAEAYAARKFLNFPSLQSYGVECYLAGATAQQVQRQDDMPKPKDYFTSLTEQAVEIEASPKLFEYAKALERYIGSCPCAVELDEKLLVAVAEKLNEIINHEHILGYTSAMYCTMYKRIASEALAKINQPVVVITDHEGQMGGSC